MNKSYTSVVFFSLNPFTKKRKNGNRQSFYDIVYY